MRFGLDVATNGAWSDVGTLADMAADAEVAGWDGFFVWDLLLAKANAAEAVADPWIALAAIAQRTERIRIGAMVTPLPRRRPWDVARQAATVDRLSRGRLVFGAGLGWQDDDYARFGEDADPRARAARLGRRRPRPPVRPACSARCCWACWAPRRPSPWRRLRGA